MSTNLPSTMIIRNMQPQEEENTYLIAMATQ
jgi:hypothetical protein